MRNISCTALHDYPKGGGDEVGADLFSRITNDEIRGNAVKLRQWKFRFDVRKKLFLKEQLGSGMGCPGR